MPRSGGTKEKGSSLYRLSIMFFILALVCFIIGVTLKSGTTLWLIMGMLGILFMAAAFTAHYLHEAEKETF